MYYALNALNKGPGTTGIVKMPDDSSNSKMISIFWTCRFSEAFHWDIDVHPADMEGTRKTHPKRQHSGAAERRTILFNGKTAATRQLHETVSMETGRAFSSQRKPFVQSSTTKQIRSNDVRNSHEVILR